MDFEPRPKPISQDSIETLAQNCPALFFKRLAASATKQVAMHRIYNDLKSSGIRIGKNALYDFMREAEDIFLVRTLPKYPQKISTHEPREKKVYFIGSSMLNAIRYRFSGDRGKAMEQAVFWHLQRETIRTGAELFYLCRWF